MAELILYSEAVLLESILIWHTNRDLYSNGFLGFDSADCDNLRELELIFTTREDEMRVSGPTDLPIIHKDVLLLDGLAWCKPDIVLVAKGLERKAEHRLHLHGGHAAIACPGTFTMHQIRALICSFNLLLKM